MANQLQTDGQNSSAVSERAGKLSELALTFCVVSCVGRQKGLRSGAFVWSGFRRALFKSALESMYN